MDDVSLSSVDRLFQTTAATDTANALVSMSVLVRRPGAITVDSWGCRPSFKSARVSGGVY